MITRSLPPPPFAVFSLGNAIFAASYGNAPQAASAGGHDKVVDSSQKRLRM
jgi:hypothetical protein